MLLFLKAMSLTLSSLRHNHHNRTMAPKGMSLEISLILNLLNLPHSLKAHLSETYQPVIDVECENTGVTNNYQSVDPAKKPRFDVSATIRSPNKRYLAVTYIF